MQGEEMEKIFKDFQDIIIPGITHWQSPNFFAYFTANSSYPSVLAEMLTATLGAQCMIWETSPAATELEEKVMDWLKQMIGLPDQMTGVIQDTASTSTLVAILTAREKVSGHRVNTGGFANHLNMKVYCSTETHSSIEKAVKIAGLGKENLVKIGVNENLGMDPEKLRAGLADDIRKGNLPTCVVATLGTTSTLAMDPLQEIANICKEFNVWLHVDAAMAGSALVLEENRQLLLGMEEVDSFVFNPHKWMFTNFDCSAYFVKDTEALKRTFEIMPEYLKTRSDSQVNNYRDWGIQLGRRFRSLKLWFVIREYGTHGIAKTIRHHISLAEKFEKNVKEHPDFELMVPRSLNLVCFRYHPENVNEKDLDKINEELLNKLNNTGKLYITHTKINEKYTLRMVIGQTNVIERNVDEAWGLIRNMVGN
jgi:aromatic-L-amino-acid decarboxylase